MDAQLVRSARSRVRFDKRVSATDGKNGIVSYRFFAVFRNFAFYGTARFARYGRVYRSRLFGRNAVKNGDLCFFNASA